MKNKRLVSNLLAKVKLETFVLETGLKPRLDLFYYDAKCLTYN